MKIFLLRLLERHVVAMTVNLTTMAALLWMPAMLGALSLAYGLGPRALSHIAFAELFGFLIGTLITSTKKQVELTR